MPTITQSQLNTYFKAVAVASSYLQHDDSVEQKAFLTADEFLNADMEHFVADKVLMLEPYDPAPQERGADDYQFEKQCAFSILVRYDTQNIGAEQTALDTAEHEARFNSPHRLSIPLQPARPPRFGIQCRRIHRRHR